MAPPTALLAPPLTGARRAERARRPSTLRAGLMAAGVTASVSAFCAGTWAGLGWLMADHLF